MEWQFDDVPMTVATPDGGAICVGSFHGRFSFDDVGSITDIWLDEHVHPRSTRTLRLTRFAASDGAPAFSHNLFTRLASTLQARYADEIDEWTSASRESAFAQRQRDLAWHRSRVL